MSTRRRGFTLIELLVVLAIISILASVANSWYSSSVRRGNRGEAISPMQTILDAQERYYADNVTYTTDLSDLGYASATLTTTKGFYVINAQTCDDSSGAAMALTQCVELYATAQGLQTQDGDLVTNTLGRQERVMPDGTIREWTGN
ncbi:MAG: prepilin-type N-terminal cleavage/methylation domain-containing protein [Pseudomonadota bacterium]|nr:prepilin-type N-terminal cleavage/methylation domain-containing protein [Pseudomonadota bacterium]